MRHGLAIAAIVLMTAAPAMAAEWDVNAHINLAYKGMQSKWKPFDSQLEHGGQLDFGRGDWPVHILVELEHSFAEKSGPVTASHMTHQKAATNELGIGLRKIWTNQNASTYIGAGVLGIQADFEYESTLLGKGALTDSTAGYFISSGAYYTIGQKHNIGVEIKYSEADVQLSGFGFAGSMPVGGLHMGIFAGWHWGD